MLVLKASTNPFIWACMGEGGRGAVKEESARKDEEKDYLGVEAEVGAGLVELHAVAVRHPDVVEAAEVAQP